MARIAAILPAGSRITDSVSLGVVAKTFPIDTVRSALSVTGRASIRERDLPAHVMMYYVIALALYMQQCSAREVLRCLLEGIQWLSERWRASVRNSGRLQIGIPAGIKSEYPAGLRRNPQAAKQPRCRVRR